MPINNVSSGVSGDSGVSRMAHQFGVNHADVVAVSAVLRLGVSVPTQFTDPTCAAIIATRIDEYATSQPQVRHVDVYQRRIARELLSAVRKGLRPLDEIDVLLGGGVDVDSLASTVFEMVENGGRARSRTPYGGLFGPTSSSHTRLATGVCVMSMLLAHPSDAYPEAWALLPGLG